MRKLVVVSPTAILGYGFPESSFEKAMTLNPQAICVDGGSVDPGPFYLGAGKPFVSYHGVKRDLKLIVGEASKRRIPVLVGTAGGSGSKVHVEWTLRVLRDVAQESGVRLRVAVIYSDVSKERLHKLVDEGKVRPCGPVEGLSHRDIDEAVRIVAQIGVEPFVEALKQGADFVLGGRAYDPAPFAALPILQGMDEALAIHMGKILECAAIAAEPGSGRDVMIGEVKEGCFEVEPASEERRCTVYSVAAHSLYEKSDPYFLPGPGGVLDLRSCSFEQVTERRVRVKGTKLIKNRYTVKVEGVRKVGYRAISIAGIRDPLGIRAVRRMLAAGREAVRKSFPNLTEWKDYRLLFRVYGISGVMGSLEPHKEPSGKEACVIIEAVSKDQELSNSIVSIARSTMLHYGYPGRVSTAGNLAFPYSPSDIAMGEAYEFNIHHVVEVPSPFEFVEISFTQIP